MQTTWIYFSYLGLFTKKTFTAKKVSDKGVFMQRYYKVNIYPFNLFYVKCLWLVWFMTILISCIFFSLSLPPFSPPFFLFLLTLIIRNSWKLWKVVGKNDFEKLAKYIILWNQYFKIEMIRNVFVILKTKIE